MLIRIASKKITLDYPKSAVLGFETAMVNESSVFEPLKFFCIFTFLSALLGF